MNTQSQIILLFSLTLQIAYISSDKNEDPNLTTIQEFLKQNKHLSNSDFCWLKNSTEAILQYKNIDQKSKKDFARNIILQVMGKDSRTANPIEKSENITQITIKLQANLSNLVSNAGQPGARNATPPSLQYPVFDTVFVNQRCIDLHESELGTPNGESIRNHNKALRFCCRIPEVQGK